MREEEEGEEEGEEEREEDEEGRERNGKQPWAWVVSLGCRLNAGVIWFSTSLFFLVYQTRALVAEVEVVRPG